MNVTYSQIVGFEPVTVLDVRRQARIDNDVWEDVGWELEPYIRDHIIPASREIAEGFLRRPIVAREVTYDLTEWETDPLTLWTTPVRALTKISFVDENGDAQEMVGENFIVSGNGYPANLFAKPGVLWPYPYPGTGIRVTVVAGIATNDAEVPHSVRQAMLLLAADMYENRENTIVGKENRPLYLSAKKILRTESIPMWGVV